jgi:hypothetical protein
MRSTTDSRTMFFSPTTSLSLIVSCSFVTAVLVLGACSGDEGQPTNGTSSSSGTTTTPEDAGTPEAEAEAAAPTKKKNAEDCTKNEECESNLCFIDRQKFCSLACTPANAATVCVAPFTGTCNGKGFCKRD